MFKKYHLVSSLSFGGFFSKKKPGNNTAKTAKNKSDTKQPLYKVSSIYSPIASLFTAGALCVGRPLQDPPHWSPGQLVPVLPELLQGRLLQRQRSGEAVSHLHAALYVDRYMYIYMYIYVLFITFPTVKYSFIMWIKVTSSENDVSSDSFVSDELFCFALVKKSQSH